MVPCPDIKLIIIKEIQDYSSTFKLPTWLCFDDNLKPILRNSISWKESQIFCIYP